MGSDATPNGIFIFKLHFHLLSVRKNTTDFCIWPLCHGTLLNLLTFPSGFFLSLQSSYLKIMKVLILFYALI